MRDPYYSVYQHHHAKRLAQLRQQLATMRKNRNTLLDCGLKPEADRMAEEILQVRRAHDSLAEAMIADRNLMVAELLKVFLLAYLTYTMAGEWEDLVRRLTGTRDSSLSQDVSRMVSVIEEIALAIDMGGEGKQAVTFGELTDQLESDYRTVLEPTVNEIIDKAKTTPKFRRIFNMQ